MTEPTAVTASFNTHQEAKDASEILNVFFKVLPAHPVEPWNSRPWEITILIQEGTSQETLYVTPEMRDEVREVIHRCSGQVRRPAGP